MSTVQWMSLSAPTVIVIAFLALLTWRAYKGSTHDVTPGHPWALLKGLVDEGIITKTDARDLVMVHQNVYRRLFLDLQELLDKLLRDEILSPEAHHHIMKLINKVQREEIPQ